MVSRPSIPQSIQQQNIQSAGKAPSGYRMMSDNVSTEVSQTARQILSKPFGTENYITLNGVKYFFRVEPHYDNQKQWHKGVTAYEPAATRSTKERIEDLDALIKKMLS